MNDLIKETEKILENAVAKLKEELGSIRGNRPSAELVEKIKVSCYGQPMELKQLASISIKPPREIEMSVWDKTVVAPIMKAIDAANIGLTVTNDNNIIRAFLPSLTEERRQEFMKLAKKTAENFKIQIRGHRDETLKKLKIAEEKGELSEDELFKAKEKLQKAIDEANKKIENLLENKIKELSE